MNLQASAIAYCAEEGHVDLVYLAVAIGFFILSGWLIKVLDRL
jgi:hypothetical protein